MIIISSTTRVKSIVGHGNPAVNSKSKSSRGVVMTLEIFLSIPTPCNSWTSANLPVDVAHVEDGAVSAMNARVAPRKFDGNGSETEVGAHGEIGDGGHHCNQGGDVVKDAVGTRLGE